MKWSILHFFLGDPLFGHRCCYSLFGKGLPLFVSLKFACNGLAEFTFISLIKFIFIKVYFDLFS